MTSSLDLTGWVLRAVLVLGLAALVAAAALVLSSGQSERYDASVRLSYAAGIERQALGLVDGTDNKVRLNTEAAALESYDLAVRTSRAAPGLRLTPDAVADRVSAAAVPDSQVVVLTAHAETPERAVELLEAYRDQYLAVRRDSERAGAQVAERALRRRLADLPRGQRDGALAATLRTQLGALAVVRRSGSGTPAPLEEVRRPVAASAPRTGRNVLFGALFGLAAGIGLVALLPKRERRRDPVAPAAPPEISGGKRKTAGRRAHG